MTDNLLRVIVDQRQQTQRDRIRFGNRLGALERGDDEGTEAQVALAEKWAKLFRGMEKEMNKDITELVRDHFFYPYLSSVDGVGPMLAAKIISQVDISRSPTRAALWRYAGYGVVDGKAERLKKGKKAHFNKGLKTSMFQVGDSFIKHQTRYTDIYYNHKQRYQQREEQRLGDVLDMKAKEDKAFRVVWGELFLVQQWAVITGFYDKYFWSGASAWALELNEVLAGRSLAEAQQDEMFVAVWSELSKSKRKEVADQFDNPNFWRPLEPWITIVKETIKPWRKEVALYPPIRRHRMAMRKMVKLFLSHLWEVWRTVEGMDTRPPYPHEYLGHVTYYDPVDFGWPKYKHLAK